MHDVMGWARRSELSRLSWQKSSHSAGEAECVEVAVLDGLGGPAGLDGPAGAVAVRDSKNASGPALVFAAEEWRAFVLGAQAGEFDRH